MKQAAAFLKTGAAYFRPSRVRSRTVEFESVEGPSPAFA
jgi:hypothetical protein